MKKQIMGKKGITLIALVITIIVLLILAGVTIVTLTGDNGILTKAGNAKDTSIDGEIEEEIKLAWNKVYMDSYLNSATDKANALKTELEKNGHTVEDVSANGNKITITNYRGKDKVLDVSTGTINTLSAVAKAISTGTVFSDNNTPITDEYGNTFIVPKGFKLSKDSAEVVTEGIVIEDATYTNTIGSEFVWIPVSKDNSDVNKVKGATKSASILLRRYVFHWSGNVDTELSKSDPQDQLKTYSDASYYFTEALKNSTTDNMHAKDIEDFIEKTNVAGGFWIGRYEARTTSTTARAKNDTLTAVTEKPENSVYNYMIQTNAAKLSRKMYEKENDGTTIITKFESDLINSYAWDTATLFLQEYDNRTDEVKGNSNYKVQYSQQTSYSTERNNTGTNASTIEEANKDKICNVYDMAGNFAEWSTETYSPYYNGCYVLRGGYTNSIHENFNITSNRSNCTNTDYDSNSFRPILYVK